MRLKFFAHDLEWATFQPKRKRAAKQHVPVMHIPLNRLPPFSLPSTIGTKCLSTLRQELLRRTPRRQPHPRPSTPSPDNSPCPPPLSPATRHAAPAPPPHVVKERFGPPALLLPPPLRVAERGRRARILEVGTGAKEWPTGEPDRTAISTCAAKAVLDEVEDDADGDRRSPLGLVMTRQCGSL